MKKTPYRRLLLALSLVVGWVGCAGKQETGSSSDTTEPADPAAGAATALQLDESKLPPVNRLQKSDVDPAKAACADFAGHVNSKWLAANDLPGDRTSWGAFEMLGERSIAVQRQLAEQASAREGATGIMKIVGDVWATGMDDASINALGITPIEADLAAIEALKDAAGIAAYVRTSYARGEGFLFSFGPEADFKDSSMNIAYATQAGLGLPDKGYYVDDDKKDKREAYQVHIAKVLELSGIAADAAAAQAKDVMAFESRLAKVSRSREELSRDVKLWYNPVSIEDADKLTPNFPWPTFFESQGVTTPKMFSLAMPEFHAEVSKMMADVPVEQWRSYLRFHTVDSASPYLADAFVQESYNFYSKAMRGQKEMKPRHKRVLATVNGEVGEALGEMYVQVAFSPKAKERMQGLVKNLGGALKTRIENLDWMSAETKKKAMEKWASFRPKIGYPDKWRDWSGLTTSRESYIGNVRATMAFNHTWELSKIGKPVDKAEWGMSPQTVNAYYNPLQNEIVFPAAILQPPFFDLEADDAVNYGGIGAVIGHEMIHGYDDQGSRFGPTGNFEQWWTEADSKAFAAKTKKLVGQFNLYEAFPGGNVNGKLTLGENIADLGGLSVSYDAMQTATAGNDDPKLDGFTREQRFFMNWATVWRRNFTPDELKVRVATDSHAPANFRAIGAPSNLKAFAEAFDCKDSDGMVRAGDDQIVIW